LPAGTDHLASHCPRQNTIEVATAAHDADAANQILAQPM
jgi:hypothetical protein